MPNFISQVDVDGIRAYIKDEALTTALNTEIAAREAADTQLRTDLQQDISDGVAAEAAARTSADTSLNNRITEVNNTLNGQISDINEDLNKFGTNTLFAYDRKYIDGVNGNDNNSGTIDAPYRTLDRLFADMKYGGDVRAYIVSAGVYESGLSVFQNGTLHLTATVAGVHLKFIPASGNSYLSVYNAHWNLSGVSMEQPMYIDAASAVPHFENCSTTWQYVQFESGLYITGGYIGLDSCIAAAGADTMSYLSSSIIRISGALGYIWGCRINVNVERQYAIYIHNKTQLLYRGNASSANVINFNVDNCGGCIYMYSAELEVVDTGMTFNNPTQAQYGLYMSNGHAAMTAAMKRKFEAVGSGIYHTAIGSLLTGWAELPYVPPASGS